MNKCLNKRIINQYQQLALDFEILEDFKDLYDISDSDKIFILNEFIPKAATEEIKQNLIAYKQELINKISNLNKCKVVDQQVGYFTPSKFVEGISPKMSQMLYDEIRLDVYRAIQYDEKNKNIIVDQNDLNHSLITYKQEMLNILYANFNVNVRFSSVNESTSYNYYQQVMHQAENFIKYYINQHEGQVKEDLSQDTRSTFFNVLKAFTVLNNFDEIIENMSDQTIAIDPKSRGNYDIPTDKFNFKENAYFHASFEDDFSAVDGSKHNTNLLKQAFGWISISESGDRLQPSDIVLLTNILNSLRNNLEVDKNSLIDKSIWTNYNTEEAKDALLNTLEKNYSFRNKFGDSRALAVVRWFREYNEAFNKRLNIMTDVEQKRKFIRERDLLLQLLSTVRGQRANAYVSASPSGNKEQNPAEILQKKQHIVNSIKNKTRSNYENCKDNLYNFSDTTFGFTLSTFDDFYSDVANKVFTEMLGFYVDDEIKKILSENPSITSQFLTRLQTLYLNHISNKILNKDQLEAQIELLIEELVKTPEYVVFTNLLVSTQSASSVKIYDSNNNMLPTVGIQTAAQDTDRQREELKSFINTNRADGEAGTYKNVLLKQSNLLAKSVDSKYTTHELFRSDIILRGNHENPDMIIDTVSASPAECMGVALQADYLTELLNNNVLYLQIECYSDKPRIPIYAYNFSPHGEEEIDYRTSTDKLKAAWKNQFIQYYEVIEQSILKKWNSLGYQFDNIDDLCNKLNTEPLTEEEFIQNIIAKQSDDNKINFTKGIDYYVLNDKITFNSSLYLYIKAASNDNLLEAIYQEGLQDFYKSMQEMESIPLSWDAKANKDNLKAILGIDNITGLKSWNELEGGELSKRSQDILEKYYATFILMRDAELQSNIKFPIIHDAKKSIPLDKAIKAVNSEKIDDILQGDLFYKMSAGKKRNSSGTAAATPQISTKYGVPAKIKAAIIKFPKVPTTTHFGQSDELKPHDGASHVDGIYGCWEMESYPGHYYEGVRKTIGIIGEGAGITMIKHADNTLTNELLRNMSFNEGNSNYFTADNLLRKMRQPCKITKEFIDNWRANKIAEHPLEFATVYYDFNGVIAELVDVSIDDSGRFKFTWQAEDGSEIDQTEIAKMIGAEPTTDGYIKIDNLYQLSKAFGGIYSMSYNENNELVYSEISNMICADLISEFDSKMKETIIGKLHDSEAIKSSSVAVNPENILTSNQELAWFWYDTSKYGLQQDYTHDSTDALIPSTTQVFGSLGFGGQNLDYVQDVYMALSKVVEKSLKKLTDKYHTDFQGLKVDLSKKLWKSLQKNSVASSAMDIVQDYLNEVKKGNYTELGFSNPEIIYKVQSNIAVELNNIIKQKFDGIAVIQAPSQGIVMLYEDINGNTYTKLDIIKRAKKEISSNPNFAGKYLTEQELVANYFNIHVDIFPKEYLINKNNIDQLYIGDTITVDGESEIIRTPQQLQQTYENIQSGKTIYKDYTKSRDLKPRNVTWTEADGTKNNLFFIASTKAVMKDRKNKFNLLWQRTNLQTLSKYGRYFKTEDDFKAYLKYNNLEDHSTEVFDLKNTEGEQVIPKRYSQFKEGSNSLADIREQGPKFFEAIVRAKYSVSTEVRKGEVGIAFDDFECVLKPMSEEVTGLLNTEEDGIGNWYIYGSAGEKILKVPSSDFKGKLTKSGDRYILEVYVQNDNSADYKNKCRNLISIQRKHINFIKDNTGSNLHTFNKFIKKGSDEEYEMLATEMYNSWKLTHYTISVRIPTQSYQSFLPLKTAAYTENSLNYGYMNIWEMLLQGSKIQSWNL